MTGDEREAAAEFMTTADANGDGTVDKEGFAAANPKPLQILSFWVLQFQAS
jgi:hypothetical protein